MLIIFAINMTTVVIWAIFSSDSVSEMPLFKVIRLFTWYLEKSGQRAPIYYLRLFLKVSLSAE